MKNLNKEKNICKHCKWHENFTGVCYNGDSKYRADFTNDEFSCAFFETDFVLAKEQPYKDMYEKFIKTY